MTSSFFVWGIPHSRLYVMLVNNDRNPLYKQFLAFFVPVIFLLTVGKTFTAILSPVPLWKQHNHSCHKN